MRLRDPGVHLIGVRLIILGRNQDFPELDPTRRDNRKLGVKLLDHGFHFLGILAFRIGLQKIIEFLDPGFIALLVQEFRRRDKPQQGLEGNFVRLLLFDKTHICAWQDLLVTDRPFLDLDDVTIGGFAE